MYSVTTVTSHYREAKSAFWLVDGIATGYTDVVGCSMPKDSAPGIELTSMSQYIVNPAIESIRFSGYPALMVFSSIEVETRYI